jgi:hypothetical protein
METIPGGLAFACLVAAQFFAVFAVHNARRRAVRAGATHPVRTIVHNTLDNERKAGQCAAGP